MQPKLLLPPTFSHGLITVNASSRAHPILSSNLSRNFKTLLQDSSAWHLVIITLDLSWKKLHWLPISERITHKVACMCFHVRNESGRTYLSELLQIYAPSCTLRSSSNSRMLKIQQHKRKLSHFHLLWTLSLEFTPTRYQAMLNSSIF